MRKSGDGTTYTRNIQRRRNYAKQLCHAIIKSCKCDQMFLVPESRKKIALDVSVKIQIITFQRRGAKLN